VPPWCSAVTSTARGSGDRGAGGSACVLLLWSARAGSCTLPQYGREPGELGRGLRHRAEQADEGVPVFQRLGARPHQAGQRPAPGISARAAGSCRVPKARVLHQRTTARGCDSWALGATAGSSHRRQAGATSGRATCTSQRGLQGKDGTSWRCTHLGKTWALVPHSRACTHVMHPRPISKT
jgi:hypothetical protein